MVLEFEKITKVFRSQLTHRPTMRIGPISFGIDQGEIFGYLGPNGSGKTTTIKIALGLLRPTSGNVIFFGKRTRSEDVFSRIGFLPEQPYFYRHLTPVELLEFYGGVFGLKRSEARKRAYQLLELVGLSEFASLRIGKLSKGMVQRVGLAQALVNDPELLILDEPLSGLDPVGRYEIRDLILKLKQQDKTIFLSSHILQDIEMMCDRVAILWKGKVIEVLNVNDLLEKSTSGVEITVEHISLEVARRLGIGEISWTGKTIRMKCKDNYEANRGLKALIGLSAEIKQVVPVRSSLEEYFVHRLRSLEECKEKAQEEVAISTT